jgi:hypothetical protein
MSMRILRHAFFRTAEEHLRESFGPGGDDKELLESKLVAGMLSTIDHIEARHWKSIRVGVSSEICIVLEERDSLTSSTGLAGSQGNYR